MKKMNVILVYSASQSQILMCKRRKAPYEGLYNLVGGKAQSGEDGLSAAYRELEEETAISSCDIELIHAMDFIYYIFDICLEVYFGTLKREIDVFGQENDLFWIDVSENFFDSDKYAGEGNIGHIVQQVKYY